MATPIVIDQFRSLATRWAPEKAPPSLALRARNCVFVGETVHPRAGLSEAFVGPSATASITGLGEFQLTDGTRLTLGLDSVGNLFKESPTTGVSIIDSTMGADRFLDVAAAYHRAYIAVSDLQTGLGDPKVYYRDTDNVFRFEPVGMDPNDEPAGSGGASFAPGDIQAGLRYVIVMYRTRTGYTSGWTRDAVLAVDVTDDNSKIDISNPPVGPSQTVDRLVAFTQAGSSADGPYFAILEDADIQGLTAPITATIIPNNLAGGTYTFNFTDDYLVSSTDVTDFIDKIALVPQKSVLYSKTLQRLIWAGEDQDIFRVSEADDPETYMGSTGFVQPGLGDGGIAMRAIEFKTETFMVKDNGGFSVSDSTLTPAEWSTPRRWSNSGPMGPWAIDSSDQFMAWAHRSGPYIYTGDSPVWIGYEISGNAANYPSWDKINWLYAHLIYTTIDTETKTVRFGVPMDQSTQVNMEFVVDYSQGWKNRRWSQSDISATRALRVTRRMPASPNPGSPIDNRVSTTQLLYAMNTLTGTVAYEDPTSILDMGQGFTQEFQTGYTPIQKIPGIYQIQAVEVTAGGEGGLSMTVYPTRAKPIVLSNVSLDGDADDFICKLDNQNERWSILVSNNTETGGFFVLHRLIIWIVKLWDARP